MILMPVRCHDCVSRQQNVPRHRHGSDVAGPFVTANGDLAIIFSVQKSGIKLHSSRSGKDVNKFTIFVQVT
jgi:hypothetical protein